MFAQDRPLQRLVWTVVLALLLSLSVIPRFSRWLEEFVNTQDSIRDGGLPEIPMVSRHSARAC
jgi:hypothetical protein